MDDRFRLVAGVRDMAAVVEASGCVTDVSPSFQNAFDLNRADLVGTLLWELVHPDDVSRVRQALADVFQGCGTAALAFQILGGTGRWHHVDTVVQREPDGGLARATVHASDVSERRQGGGPSDDAGNLLSAILDASGRILDGLPVDSPLRSDAEEIRRMAGRVGSMIRQRLSVTPPAGAGPTELDLNAVMDEAQHVLRRLLGGRIELEIVRAPGLWTVRADRSQIEQVLRTLAVNARDAMPSGGRLTVESWNRSKEETSSDGLPLDAPGVVVRVTDTSVGMNPAARARLFDPFFTTQGPGEGTGLGLATVRTIVEDSGGWLHLATAPGQGTTVTFGLPRSTAAPSGPPRPVASSRTGMETVLLVEDEAGVRELVRDMLSLAGYRVLEASAPSEAERISHGMEEPIDLLLTDVVMPEMSGLELSRRLSDRRPGLRVMYMSGFPNPAMGDGTAAPPGVHFLAKPFNRQSLLSSVRQALDAGTPA